jgi:3-hydroxyisobutyrate dehydrogenase-like beta-hydroxyacid dehydrogenase
LFARVLPDAPFAAAAAECRRTLCMVDTAGQAEAVILGGNGFVQNAQPRDIVVCMSTIDPMLARRFPGRLADKGIAMLDAPVSGGPHGAAAGTLSVIVGGPDDISFKDQELETAFAKRLGVHLPAQLFRTSRNLREWLLQHQGAP